MSSRQARLTEKCQPCPRTPVSYVPGLYTETKGVDRQGETSLSRNANAVGATRFEARRQ